MWLVLLLAAAAVGVAEEVEVKGRVDEVTLFRGQAMVTRVLELPTDKGTMELLVGDLPEHVVGDSLFASAEKDVEIRAVRYRKRAVAEEPREEVRKLDEQIEGIQKLIRVNDEKALVVAHREKYLSELEGFVAPTALVELTKGVLKAETLEKLTLFMFEQRAALSKERLAVNEARLELDEKLSLLQRKRKELAARGTRTVREALIFVEKREGGPASLRLSYLVNNASWSPVYNIRAAGDRAKVMVEYNAFVRQRSGESWKDVALTLSTASPALASERPRLSPYLVTLSPAVKQQIADVDFGAVQRKLTQRQQSAQAEWNIRTKGRKAQKEAGWNLLATANAFQNRELVLGRDVIRWQRSRRPSRTEGVSVAYKLPGRISLASRTDQQMLQVASMPLESDFYHVATPLLSPYVYEEARVVNTTQHTLLEGPVSAYLNGEFKGRGNLTLVAPGQDFRAGFGIDSQLRASRELVEKEERLQGGNKELTFHYRLLLENYKDTPVKVRLLDRMPVAKSTAVRITLADPKEPLSEDQLYLDRFRPRGILRWDMEVEAKATGAKARTVEYQYKMEFDKKLAPSSTPTPELERQMREEFEHMMRQ